MVTLAEFDTAITVISHVLAATSYAIVIVKHLRSMK